MDNILNRIISVLDEFSPEGSIPLEKRAYVIETITDLLSDKWNETEVIHYLRWSGHVDPRISEEIALRRMGLMRRLVEERLGKM